MKRISIFSLFLIIASLPVLAQTSYSNSQSMTYSDASSVEEVLRNYLAAGDERDVEGLKATMHPTYRVLLNDPSKGSVSALDKTTYIALAEGGKIGGIPREVEIMSLDVYQAANAQVKAKLSSEKAHFFSYYSLVKVEGKWWVAQDMVIMQPITN